VFLGPRVFVGRADRLDVVQVGSPDLQASDPAWSPDGGWIAFKGGRFDDERGVYVMGPDGAGVRRLTKVAGADTAFSPQWSPDGRSIAFLAGEPGSHSIWAINADGTAERQISAVGGDLYWPSWSPRGDLVAFIRGCCPGYSGADIHIARADGSGPVALPPLPPVDYSIPVWSPDGTKIVATLAADDASPADLVDDRVMILDLGPITTLERRPSYDSVHTTIIPAPRTGTATWQRLALDR
jgi:Tol biopolymer transport system component